MTMRASVASGAMLLGLARVVINLAGVLSLVVLARLLTPEDFGLVAIGATVMGIVVALTELSLGSALIQRAEVLRAHIDSAWTLAMLRALAILLGFVAAAYPLAVVYDDMRLVPVFVVSGVTGALAGLINPMIALQTKQMRFRPLLMIQIGQKLASLIVSILLALWLRNYWAIVAGTAIGTGLATAASYLIVRYRPRFTLSRARDILGFSSWMFFGQLVNVLNWRFDQLVIGLTLPKTDLGNYAMADNVSAVPSRETTAPLVHALFPGFAKMQDDMQRLRAAYLTAQGAIGLVALPLAFGLALLAEPVVRLALGEKWLATIPLIQVISCSYAVQTLAVGARPLAMALGETRELFAREVMGLAVRVPLVLAGLAGWGLQGLVWGRLLSAILGVGVLFLLVRKILGLAMWDQVAAHVRTVLAIAVMGAVVLAIDHQLVAAGLMPLARVLGLVPAGAIAFFGTLYLAWQVSGRPPGAETELVGLALGLLRRPRAAASR